jgi:hypothetical protein
MEVAEWLKGTPLGCYRRTPRVMNVTPNQVSEMTVVARQVNKPGRVTGFSSVVGSLAEGARWTRPSCPSGGRKNFFAAVVHRHGCRSGGNRRHTGASVSADDRRTCQGSLIHADAGGSLRIPKVIVNSMNHVPWARHGNLLLMRGRDAREGARRAVRQPTEVTNNHIVKGGL